MFLPEDHILFGPRQGAPHSHAPFQRSPDAGTDLRMPPPDLFKDGNGSDARCSLQDRYDLAIPHSGEWVGSPPAARFPLLGR
jgi:hypothetical protein